jgi:hypothetical protein
MQSLMMRTERLESLVASLPAVVVDANGRTLGPVLGLDYFGYQREYASTQRRGTTVQISLDGLPPFLAEVRRDMLVVPHQTGLRLNFESEDCTGQAWVMDGFSPSLWPAVSNEFAHYSPIGAALYMADLEQPSQWIDVRSYLRVGPVLWWGQFEYDDSHASAYVEPCTPISSELPGRDVHTVQAWPMVPVGDLRDYFEPPYRLVRAQELLDE